MDESVNLERQFADNFGELQRLCHENKQTNKAHIYKN
jgi:hypothetical protein